MSDPLESHGPRTKEALQGASSDFMPTRPMAVFRIYAITAYRPETIVTFLVSNFAHWIFPQPSLTQTWTTLLMPERSNSDQSEV
jgi:hypothetical protein